MSISAFFEQTLGANLRNIRNSWGAYNPNTNQLFLRVWNDQLQTLNGDEYIYVLSNGMKTASNGF